jgi:outer membrane protein assembly factor BamD
MRNRYIFAVLLLAALTASCGFRRHKYDDPITKDTKQPDKVLFDKAINDIEHSRYEVARITLNTLINTYDQSEYLAKAKLAIADTWYREGGPSGLAQAEAEYKDFILFYPTMEEAAESQQKICMIHYKQMEKPDRDQNQAIRAEDECRQLIVQFPNSKFVPETQQILRNIQEALADGEFAVGTFYFKRGDNSASANRLSHLVEQYPLYSRADESLWQMGQAYGKLGNRFRKQEGDAYTRIVRDYPLSGFSDDAKKKLKELEVAIPDPDPAALARMKWERDNRAKPGMLSRALTPIRRGPDVSTAARSGAPAMTTLRASVPPSVPQPAGGGTGFSGDVTATTVSDSTALDTKPDARANPQAGSGTAGTPSGTTAASSGTTTAAGGTAPQGANPTAAAGAQSQQQPNAAPQDSKKKKKKEKKPKQTDPAQAVPAATQSSSN